MEAKDTKVLETPGDYRSWEKLCQHCEVLEGLTGFEKERAKRAFQFLREELGSNFLDNAFNERHAICRYLVNLAPWTRKWITWFADALKELKKQENYSSLLNRIKDKNRFGEGFSILEIAYKFSRTGFKILIDPPIGISGTRKIPDLKVINENSGESLFVEISVVGKSKIEREAWQTMQRITDPIWRSVPFIDYCGRIHKSLAERHLEDIVKKVEKMMEELKKDNVFQELIIEDVIEIGMAPENDKEILQKWATERGLKVGEFSGPPFNVDELLRTRGRIEKEQNQLPHEYPNIVVIMNNNLFLHIKDIRKAISQLEEVVYEYPHILAVIIAGPHMWKGENEIIMKDQHVLIKKTRFDMFTEQYIILFNRFCGFMISPATITKMYNAFRSY